MPNQFIKNIADMKTIYQHIQAIITKACISEFKIDEAEIDKINFVVEKPKDDVNGDVKGNVTDNVKDDVN